MRFRMRYETRGFDEYINIYNEKNKLEYYSVVVDYSSPKRLLYNKAQERLVVVDFGTDDFDDLEFGYPIYLKGEKIGHYNDELSMTATGYVEFAHIVGLEWEFIELSERLKFREYIVKDEKGATVMKIRRPGTDFVCDISDGYDVRLALTIAAVEYWKYITTTREF